MSKTDFDRICTLTKDWSFRRKLEELFRVCVYDEEPSSRSGRGLLSIFKRRAVPS